MEIDSIVRGEVAAIAPQFDLLFWVHPSLPATVRIDARPGTTAEVMWFNLRQAPTSDPAVREALMYAIDRRALVDQLLKPFDPDASVLNCGLMAVPSIGPWCDAAAFEGFTYAPDRARAILAADS